MMIGRYFGEKEVSSMGMSIRSTADIPKLSGIDITGFKALSMVTLFNKNSIKTSHLLLTTFNIGDEFEAT